MTGGGRVRVEDAPAAMPCSGSVSAVPGVQLQYSKTQVDRAGDLLRDYFRDPSTMSDGTLRLTPELLEAIEIAHHYRSCHEYPLRKVTMGLRSKVSRESERVIVGQRFKRFPSMIDKLIRMPRMNLSRMQDIGGCRAILADVHEVRAVLRRVRKNWKPPENRFKDYVSNPARSGYRAIHVITERDHRLVEVQLRTPIQHEWAIAVERMGARTGFDLKSGSGPPELLKFFELASEGMAMEERGEAPDEAFLDRYGEARDAAAQWVE